MSAEAQTEVIAYQWGHLRPDDVQGWSWLLDALADADDTDERYRPRISLKNFRSMASTPPWTPSLSERARS